MNNQTTINCPNCATEIDISQSLYVKEANNKFQKEVQEHRAKYKEAKDALQAKEVALKAQETKFNNELEKATTAKVEAQLKVEKSKLESELKTKITAETSEQMMLLEKELTEKSSQVKDLNASKAMIEQLKREKDEMESAIKLKAEQVMNQTLKLEKEKIAKLADEANALKLKEKDEQMEQLKRSLEDAKRKVEQGSQQIQGEAQELAIEEWLSVQFPFDSIEEVKKGAFGADCVQVIHTREVQNCGVLCYESKNAQSWSNTWLDKLKQDMLKVHADIGVLVTTVLPNGMERMGFVDGVWVCTLEEFKGSASLLRESLIRVHKSVQKEENKSDKAIMLYNYLGSNEFSMQLNAIVDGFVKMQEELDKERRSLMASWKRRQKIIDGVLMNTTQMYGALQGIAGNAIGHIPTLELPYLDEGEES